jgi:peroxiredoxin
MTRLRSTISILLALQCLSGARAAEIGTKVGDFRLTDVAGQTRSLSDYSGKVLVIAFWAFKCPVSLAAGEHLGAIESKYGGRGVVVLGVASSTNESPAEVRRNAANLKIPFPVLLDADGMLAEKLGATHTPSAFVVDSGGVLRYQGGLDNPRGGGRSGPVEDSLDAILEGRPVTVPETPPSGCTLRRR